MCLWQKHALSHYGAGCGLRGLEIGRWCRVCVAVGDVAGCVGGLCVCARVVGVVGIVVYCGCSVRGWLWLRVCVFACVVVGCRGGGVWGEGECGGVWGYLIADGG